MLLMLDIQIMTPERISFKGTPVIYTALIVTVLSRGATEGDVPSQAGEKQGDFQSIAIQSEKTQSWSLLEGTWSSISNLIIPDSGFFTAT